MKAIHLRIAGITSQWAVRSIEASVSHLTGVVRVVAVMSMGIVSVLFDETLVSIDDIRKTIGSVGFVALPV
jgi:phage-related holin